MLVRIWAKLSNFKSKYSRNMSCEFYWNNWNDSTDIAV